MIPEKQRKRAAATEITWARQAFRDERYNLQQATRDRTMHNMTLARMHTREAAWDRAWGNKRLRIARAYRR